MRAREVEGGLMYRRGAVVVGSWTWGPTGLILGCSTVYIRRRVVFQEK